jgi:hypothetical protein
MIRRLPLSLVLVPFFWNGPAKAQTETPQTYCRRVGTDDTVRAIPQSLVRQAQADFGPTMPPDMARENTFFRCMDGAAMICNLGANLPCGKANTSRTNRGAASWCQQNPNADFVPFAWTGHDSVWQWRCEGSRAVTMGKPAPVDARGFFTEYWKPVR